MTHATVNTLMRAGAVIGMAAVLLALASAVMLKISAIPSSVRRPFLPVHRWFAWGSLALYAALAAACLGFHFPWDEPSVILEMGSFAVHPIIGPVGAALYAGKILAVRRFKAGWRLTGLLWGSSLFVFWVVQFRTVLPMILG